MTGVAIWGVMSTFRPNQDVVGTVRGALDQLDGLIVVDDGSGSAAHTVLESLADLGATVLRQDSNTGIAAALNRGVAHAFAGGA